MGSFVDEGVFLCDSGGRIEKQWKLYSVGMGRSHRSIIALLIETAYIVLLGQRSPDLKGFIHAGLVTAVASLCPALHNKNINQIRWIKLFVTHILKNI